MTNPQFVICISNSGYEVSLDVRKLYQLMSDEEAKKHHQLRVIDESGEDYLYPESCFLPVALSENVAQQVAHIA
ncbi:MAG: hypothetical protein HFP81_01805 [Methylococcales symbiont of Hymedesmia sp. n. MRB-2018]|nr:MAG: hypothetical protein HFP78_03165 [Methylococcales symbiont of Hymedesmia sp. n. MRB-2018]KAF3984511.1 MAG: hypothetical protein HFP81_01805 [Methylococcales symbiont of Hymedesmia sp. n. MRB-2018]